MKNDTQKKDNDVIDGNKKLILTIRSFIAIITTIKFLLPIILIIVIIFAFFTMAVVALSSVGLIDIEDFYNHETVSSGPSINTYLNNVSKKCESVIIDGMAVPIDDYVAGVISDESYTGENIETLKAQSIITRTFAISDTNMCKNSITISDSQLYNPNISDEARQVVNETKGLVLLKDDKVFNSEYYYLHTSGEYICNDNNNCTDIGQDFESILKYFYSTGVQIGDLNVPSGYTSGLSAGADGFVKRTGMPVNDNEHDRKYYFSNYNISYQAGFEGQCTWYAFGRANEILDQANSDLEWSYAPDAKYWLQYNIDSGANAFSYSTDVNEPKVGAIIVWSNDKWGHVAIVEAVNSDGTIDYSEANISGVKSASNPHGFRYQSSISYSNSGVGTISNIWSGYNFVGYIYMIE